MGRRLFVICQSYRFTAYRSIPAAAGSSTSFRASREMLGVPARKAQSQPPMSYLTLKIIHLTGLSLTFMGLAGVLASSVSAPAMPGPRRLFLTCHGLGLVILLVTGFALTLQLECTAVPVKLRQRHDFATNSNCGCFAVIRQLDRCSLSRERVGGLRP
jgi:hypothetical protein